MHQYTQCKPFLDHCCTPQHKTGLECHSFKGKNVNRYNSLITGKNDWRRNHTVAYHNGHWLTSSFSHFYSWLTVSESVTVKICPSPLRITVAINTVLHYCKVWNRTEIVIFVENRSKSSEFKNCQSVNKNHIHRDKMKTKQKNITDKN